MIKIPNINVGGRLDEGFLSDYPSLSIDNEFIPIHSLNDGELFTKKKEGIKVFFYRLNIPLSIRYNTGKFTAFADFLLSTNSTWATLSHRTIEKKYLANNGILLYIEQEPLFRVVPLMIVAVKKEYLFNIDRENPDPDQFCLLIDRKFINDEDHFKLYRNMKKYYIDNMEKEIDSMYSNDLLRLCYNSKSLSLPQFKTINEMVSYTKSINELVSQEIMSTQ